MRRLEFLSVVSADFCQDLEDLLYFNDLQSRVLPAIVKVIEQYGQPRVHRVDGSLRVTMGDLVDLQTLFAIAEDEEACQLAGVVLFVREGENLVILHLAVAPAFSTRGAERDHCVALRLVQTVRTIARRLNGVSGIVYFYPTGVPRRLPIWSSGEGEVQKTGRRPRSARRSDEFEAAATGCDRAFPTIAG